MELDQLSYSDMDLWKKFQFSEENFYSQRSEFLKNCHNKIPIIRKALKNPGDRGTALRLLLSLSVEQRLPFFDDLVDLASAAHCDLEIVREVL